MELRSNGISNGINNGINNGNNRGINTNNGMHSSPHIGNSAAAWRKYVVHNARALMVQ